MKKPKINDLKVNQRLTKKIKNMAMKSEKVKVTFYIEKKTIDKLKKIAEENGSKYQTIMNKILTEGIENNKPVDERLTKIEKEIQNLKKKLKKVA